MTRRERPAPDLWHVGEREGDDGLVIRDQNGLQVCFGESKAYVAKLVAEHNAEELNGNQP